MHKNTTTSFALDDFLSNRPSKSYKPRPHIRLSNKPIDHDFDCKTYPNFQAFVEANLHPTLSYRTVTCRIKSGWTVEDALKTPKSEPAPKYEYDGQKYTTLRWLIEAHKHFSLTQSNVTARLSNGWRLKDALETPKLDKIRFLKSQHTRNSERGS